MKPVLTVLFSVTAAVSAFLLFWCQPLISKALLPLLGGAPSVWNTAMMFFQIVLLGGYVYAHAIARLPRLWQAIIHGSVLLLAFLVLPFGDTSALVPPAQGSPLLWLVRTLAVTVGLPFFAVSASAPLLQAWFSTTGHRDARDPYFIYAASNAGSLAALLGFPFVLEPSLSVGGQGIGWAGGYALFLALLALCLSRAGAPAAAVTGPGAAIGWRERAIWAFLGFVPSSLLLGVTAYVATDLASVPLLWVVPLALYLITFIIAFGSRPISPAVLRTMLVAALSAVGSLLFFAKITNAAGLPLLLLLAVHFGGFFLVALVCHCNVAARRPPAGRLTEFYIFLSAGGATGGIFNALLAPLLFNWTYEYEIVIVAACFVGLLSPRLLAPGPAASRPIRWVVPPLAVIAVVNWPRVLNHVGQDHQLALTLIFVGAGAIVLALTGPRWPAVFGATMACLLGGATIAYDGGILHTDRSFFGVHRVLQADGGKLVTLLHGNIVHGMEYVDPARWREILTYYTPSGPIGQVIQARPNLRRVGIIGLGAGELACYAKPGQDWTFFEIDPSVLRVAQDTRYFHFLQQCGTHVRIVIGDGRLALRDEPTSGFDLLVVDAFSSDSVPMHLVTKEAFKLYGRLLAPGGWLAFHVSNRYLKLAPAIAATGEAAGFSALDESYQVTAVEAAAHAASSEWIVLAPDGADMGKLRADPRWQPVVGMQGRRPWTDSYSNILSVLR